jgi:hypothetical protein
MKFDLLSALLLALVAPLARGSDRMVSIATSDTLNASQGPKIAHNQRCSPQLYTFSHDFDHSTRSFPCSAHRRKRRFAAKRADRAMLWPRTMRIPGSFATPCRTVACPKRSKMPRTFTLPPLSTLPARSSLRCPRVPTRRVASRSACWMNSRSLITCGTLTCTRRIARAVNCVAKS